MTRDLFLSTSLGILLVLTSSSAARAQTPYYYTYHSIPPLADCGFLVPVKINNTGQVALRACTADYFSNPQAIHAALYSDGVTTDLGTLGGARSEPMSMNNHGDVVGYSGTANGQFHAFEYTNGQMLDLNVGCGEAHGINDW